MRTATEEALLSASGDFPSPSTRSLHLSRLFKITVLVAALVTAAAAGSLLTLFCTNFVACGDETSSSDDTFLIPAEALRHATLEELSSVTAATFEAKDGKVFHIKVAGFTEDDSRLVLISPFGSKLILSAYEAVYETEGGESIPLLLPDSDEAAMRTTAPIFEVIGSAEIEPEEGMHHERLLREETSRRLRGNTPRRLRGNTPRKLRGNTPRKLRGNTPRRLRGNTPRRLRGFTSSSPRKLRGASPHRTLMAKNAHGDNVLEQARAATGT